MEFMPRKNRWSPVWNWRLIEADGWRPAIALGQSSAWPSSKTSGSAFTLTAAQSFGKGFSGYLSASYAPNGDLWQIPAGVNWRVNQDWTTRIMWDGNNLHPIVTRHIDNWSMSLIMLDGSDPTLAFSIGF
jgi:hypothetical protein